MSAEMDTWDLANAKLDEATPWKPNPGDFIEGTVVGLEEMDSKYSDGKKLLLTIRDQFGKLWTFIPPTNPEALIIERFKAGVIAVGKPIGLKYVRDEPTKHGAMKRFLVKPDLPVEEYQRRANAAIGNDMMKLPQKPVGSDPGKLDDSIPF